MLPLIQFIQGIIKPGVSGLCKDRPRPLQILSVNLFSFYYISRGDDMLISAPSAAEDQHHFWQK